MQACSDLAHVVLVLVGVRRVTVVHIGYEGVLVVIHFCVAIFVRDLLYQEMFSLHYQEPEKPCISTEQDTITTVATQTGSSVTGGNKRVHW